MTYGSDEYKECLKQMGVALRHHYLHNRHHPEFWESDEKWKPAPGFEEHYEVSNLGDVRSKDRVVERPGKGDKVTKKGQVLRAQPTPKGYLRIQLVNGARRQNYMVHRLVAQVFIPNPETKPEVNHKNGKKTDNTVSNLEWATECENQIHAYETGLKEPNVKYVVHCPELDLTTLGVEKMERTLRERGHDHARASGIWRAMDRGDGPNGKHIDLTFEGTLLAEWGRDRLANMNLLDLVEMWVDWWASCQRHADGDLLKSIEINRKRFGMSDTIAEIFENTARAFPTRLPIEPTQRIDDPNTLDEAT